MKCVICGSNKAYKKLTKGYVKELYAPNIPFTYHVIQCKNCREGVTGPGYDKAMLRALGIAKRLEYEYLIKYFEKKKKGYLYFIERVFGLGHDRFKKLLADETREIDTELTILKILRSFPVVLEGMEDLRRHRYKLKGSAVRFINQNHKEYEQWMKRIEAREKGNRRANKKRKA